MDQSRFDRISRLLAGRATRRTAVAGAALFTAGATRRAAAQDATPAADGAAEGSTLFVQTAASGTFVANPGAGTPEAAGTPTPGGGADYLLTLEGHPGGTIYFSDRPERVFGEAPTQQFLGGLGFSPDDPPNAALVVQTEQGEDVAVLELVTPAYDEATGTITYGANILSEYTGEGLAHAAAQQQDAVLPEQFSRAALFIDACDSHEIVCVNIEDCAEEQDSNTDCPDSATVGNLGTHNFCWKAGDVCCGPCENHSASHWDGVCNSTFSECNGECVAQALNNQCWGD